MANYTVALIRPLSPVASVGQLHASSVVALRRFAIYDITLGVQGAPAMFANLWTFQRFTAPGVDTPVLPQPVDPGDPAAITVAGQLSTAEPTYTAGQVLRSIPLNQQATYRWAALRDDHRLIAPAVNNNGIGIQTPTCGSVGIVGTAELMFND